MRVLALREQKCLLPMIFLSASKLENEEFDVVLKSQLAMTLCSSFLLSLL
jgi:hypothetical protein